MFVPVRKHWHAQHQQHQHAVFTTLNIHSHFFRSQEVDATFVINKLLELLEIEDWELGTEGSNLIQIMKKGGILNLSVLSTLSKFAIANKFALVSAPLSLSRTAPTLTPPTIPTTTFTTTIPTTRSTISTTTSTTTHTKRSTTIPKNRSTTSTTTSTTNLPTTRSTISTTSTTTPTKRSTTTIAKTRSITSTTPIPPRLLV
ncbi:unnamed protein product [Orchesella dallaii]|uniref:Cell wall protein DAN4-like n=1 Tax=Orchesella dallaii TaxID=48710 RepID=A0ABP1RUA8_9HEXA